MAKNFTKFLVIIVAIIGVFSIMSCDDTDYSGLQMINGFVQQEDGTWVTSVASNVQTFNVDTCVKVSDEAKGWELYSVSGNKDENKLSHTVTLADNENIFYIYVDGGKYQNWYTIKIVKSVPVTVTYNSNGGTECVSQTVDSGSIVIPPTTEKMGYTFSCWKNGENKFDFTNPITENITLTAEWTPIRYSASFTNGMATVYVSFGENYTLPSPEEKEGYLFAGWYNGTELFASSGVWNFDKDVTLSPNWIKLDPEPSPGPGPDPVTEKCKVYYVIDEQTKNNSQNPSEITVGASSIVLQDPLRSKYDVFDGWYLENGQKVEEISATSKTPIVLYARFTSIAKIVYHSALGTIISNEQTVTYNSPYSLYTISCPGFRLEGWYTDSKFENKFVAPQNVWDIDREVTDLYAKWLVETYSISYVMNGGTVSRPNPEYYTIVDDNYLLCNPTKEGYTFLGWSEYGTNYCYDQYTIIKGQTMGNKILVANFSPFEFSFSDGVETGRTATVVSYNYDNSTWLKIPQVVNHNGLDYKVTVIGEEAFKGMSSKIANNEFTVELPDTLKEIKANAFNDCKNVAIVANLRDQSKLNEWANTLVISEIGNDEVLDVILNERPKIGWGKYLK